MVAGMKPYTAALQALRPKQWLKNVLVLAAPIASGGIFDLANAPSIVLAFLAFCAAASSIYLFNDTLDVRFDRAHATKRNRPIASGRLPIPAAITMMAVLAVASVVVPIVLGRWQLAIVIAVYLAVQILYCVWLKHVVVIDLAIVSSGFLLRAIAGAVAIDVGLSQWFLLVTGFGSLFMVAGKRFSEKTAEGGSAASRPILERYTTRFLHSVWIAASAVTMLSYALWAFELSAGHGLSLEALSIVPFAIAILRYAFDIEAGRAGSPEETVLRDPTLLALGAIWLVLFGAAVLARGGWFSG